jgi:hypothetical protein
MPVLASIAMSRFCARSGALLFEELADRAPRPPGLVGLVRRERRPGNQRELAITLRPEGARRVAAATLLDTAALAEALARLSPERVEAALDTLDEVLRARRADSGLRRVQR